MRINILMYVLVKRQVDIKLNCILRDVINEKIRKNKTKENRNKKLNQDTLTSRTGTRSVQVYTVR